MKKIIVVVVAFITFPLNACQKIIDCNGTSFEVPLRVHQLLQEQCQTYRELLEDAQVKRRPRIVNFSEGQSFLNCATLKCLISCLRSHREIQSISNPKKLLALISAAEYLQAPKDFVRKVWLQSQGKFNNPKLKKHEGEFISLGNKLFSLGEYINHHAQKKTHNSVARLEKYSRLPGPNTLFVNTDLGPFKIKNLQGLSLLSDFAEFCGIERLVLRGASLTDFNLKELITHMPRLHCVDMGDNNIRRLKRTHIEGMPNNFSLVLCDNPLESIEDDCLSHEIIRHASGSTIALYRTQLKSEQLEKFKEQWRLHTDEAHVAVFFTHLLAASCGLPCMALIPLLARDLDHLQKCRQLDWIDGLVIVSTALLFTLYIMYSFTFDRYNKNYQPQSVTLQTSVGDYQCYNDSFVRNFCEFFKYSIGLSRKKNNA